MSAEARDYDGISASLIAVEQPTAMKVATPMDLLNVAIQKGASMEQLEKFMDLHERWEKNEAIKAYNVAIAAFKSDPPAIIKDASNKQYGSMYASLGNIVNTANPILSKHGLSARWDISQDKIISVTCILSHVLGHSEHVTLNGPPDDSGKKNALQQIKSTVTYLQNATFMAITGLASIDGDDDGNGASTPKENQTHPQQQKNKLPECHEIAFNEICKKYKPLIISGGKTGKELIAWLSAKTVLTENQKSIINSWKGEK